MILDVSVIISAVGNVLMNESISYSAKTLCGICTPVVRRKIAARCVKSKINDALGNYSEALKNYKDALSIKRISLPENHPDIALSLNNIGIAYHGMGNYSEALKNYEETYDTIIKTLSKDHPNALVISRNIEKLKKKMNDE